jgi:hypothetical protein
LERKLRQVPDLLDNDVGDWFEIACEGARRDSFTWAGVV